MMLPCTQPSGFCRPMSMLGVSFGLRLTMKVAALAKHIPGQRPVPANEIWNSAHLAFDGFIVTGGIRSGAASIGSFASGDEL